VSWQSVGEVKAKRREGRFRCGLGLVYVVISDMLKAFGSKPQLQFEIHLSL